MYLVINHAGPRCFCFHQFPCSLYLVLMFESIRSIRLPFINTSVYWIFLFIYQLYVLNRDNFAYLNKRFIKLPIQCKLLGALSNYLFFVSSVINTSTDHSILNQGPKNSRSLTGSEIKQMRNTSINFSVSNHSAASAIISEIEFLDSAQAGYERSHRGQTDSKAGETWTFTRARQIQHPQPLIMNNSEWVNRKPYEDANSRWPVLKTFWVKRSPTC